MRVQESGFGVKGLIFWIRVLRFGFEVWEKVLGSRA